MRCSAVPTTNVAVSGVTQPTANLKVSPRGAACTAFIEKWSGACMHGVCAGANAPLLGGFKWLPWGLPFAMRLSGWLEA